MKIYVALLALAAFAASAHGQLDASAISGALVGHETRLRHEALQALTQLAPAMQT